MDKILNQFHIILLNIFSDTQVKIEICKGSDYGKVFISTPSIPLGCNTWLETGDIGHYNQAEHTLHFMVTIKI